MDDLLHQENLSSESRKKLLSFIKILDEKAELDENYASNLEKLSKSLTLLIDSRQPFLKTLIFIYRPMILALFQYVMLV